MVRKKEESGLVAELGKLSATFNEVVKGGDSLLRADEFGKPEVLPTGFPELDNRILVIGGIPRGRVIEIAGKTGAGKSTLAINIMAQAIKRGLRCVYADKEGTMTWEYGETIGAPKDSYLIYRGRKVSGPEFLENVLLAIESGADLVILDSLSFIASEEVSDADLSKQTMHVEQSTSKLTKAFSQKLYSGWEVKLGKKKKVELKKGQSKKGTSGPKISILDTDCTLIIINHLKDAVGDSYAKPPADSRGGETIKFAYSMRIFLEKLRMKKEDILYDENGFPIFIKVKVICEKNKLAPPMRSTYMWIKSATGVFSSNSDTVLMYAMEKGVLKKVKNTYTFVHSFCTGKDTKQLLPKGINSVSKFVGKSKIIEVLNKRRKLISYIMSGT